MSERYVVMPRGINVGTRNRIPMADLRRLLSERGYTDVITISQSGNIVLTGSESSATAGTAVEKILADEFGVQVRCVVRTADQIRSVLASDPLGHAADDPARYLVNFLSPRPSPDAVEGLLAEDHSPEVLVVEGSEAYVWTPEGVRAMRLSYTYLEKRLGVVVTARNWNTLGKIAATL